MGMKIIESLHMPKTMLTPVRKHIRKPWMTEAYHKRIQKKWNKRFGQVDEPCILMTPQGICCHPEVAREIEHAVRKQMDGYSPINPFML